MTPAGIEPATFRFVAQHLNNGVKAVPALDESSSNFIHMHIDVKQHSHVPQAFRIKK